MLTAGVLASLAVSGVAQAQMCHYGSLVDCYDACRASYFACGRAIPRVPASTCLNEYNQCAAWCEYTCPDDWGTEIDDGGTSPIVIALGPGPPRFTAAENGVLFDIDGDGHRDAIAWTDPRGGDGFLALDRDFNGSIDSGRELFGNHTAQPTADHPNGFLALAVFDASEAGGNGDGAITPADGIWPALQLWVDVNHNGRSELGELTSLNVHGITAIDLDYRESRRLDRFGNELRFWSRVSGVEHPTVAVDVFFARL
jgi:hypothetical protein